MKKLKPKKPNVKRQLKRVVAKRASRRARKGRTAEEIAADREYIRALNRTVDSFIVGALVSFLGSMIGPYPARYDDGTVIDIKSAMPKMIEPPNGTIK